MLVLALVGLAIAVGGGTLVFKYTNYSRLNGTLLHPREYLFFGIAAILIGIVLIGIATP